MIVHCPKCGHRGHCSDKFIGKNVECPKCNTSIHLESSDEFEISREQQKPRVIEQTGKQWKAIQLVGIIISACSGCGACIAFSSQHRAGGLFMLLLFGGLVLFLTGRIGAWWYHA